MSLSAFLPAGPKALGLAAGRPPAARTLNRRFFIAGSAFAILPAAPARALDAADRTLDAHRVGAIVRSTPPEDIAKIYGAGHVAAIKIGGEGDEYSGVSVHAGTHDEIQVAFTTDGKRILFIRIVGRRWKTTRGVSIGTGLAELERINGGAFTFNGFGWDLGGIVRDEPRTRFAGGGLRVAVDAQRPAPPGKDRLVQGDQPITSRNPILRQMDVRVYLLEVHFSE